MKLGVIKGDEPWWSHYMNLFWLLGLLASIVKTTYLMSVALDKETFHRSRQQVILPLCFALT